MRCKGLHTPLGREKRGSSPTFSTRAVIISSNLLPHQNGYLPCRIALFVIGMQVKMGVLKWTGPLAHAPAVHLKEGLEVAPLFSDNRLYP